MTCARRVGENHQLSDRTSEPPHLLSDRLINRPTTCTRSTPCSRQHASPTPAEMQPSAPCSTVNTIHLQSLAPLISLPYPRPQPIITPLFVALRRCTAACPHHLKLPYRSRIPSKRARRPHHPHGPYRTVPQPLLPSSLVIPNIGGFCRKAKPTTICCLAGDVQLSMSMASGTEAVLTCPETNGTQHA